MKDKEGDLFFRGEHPDLKIVESRKTTRQKGMEQTVVMRVPISKVEAVNKIIGK